MKRQLLVCFLAIMASISICGYAGKNETEGVSDAKEQLDQELELMGKYVDIDAYAKNNGVIAEHKLTDRIDEIEIDGQILKIGMSYDEIILKGFTPVDKEFKNTKTGYLAYLCDFETGEGHIVRLGFIGEKDETVEDGSLYSISVRCMADGSRASSFKVADIDENTLVSEIISELGEPYRVDGSVYEAYLDMVTEYRFENDSVYLKFYIDLETEEISTVCIEGNK